MATSKDKSFFIDAMIAFSKISGWIVAPIVAAVFIGGWYDEKHQSGSKFFMIAAGVAMVITIVGITIETKKYSKMIKAQEQKKDTTQ